MRKHPQNNLKNILNYKVFNFIFLQFYISDLQMRANILGIRRKNPQSYLQKINQEIQQEKAKSSITKPHSRKLRSAYSYRSQSRPHTTATLNQSRTINIKRRSINSANPESRQSPMGYLQKQKIFQSVRKIKQKKYDNRIFVIRQYALRAYTQRNKQSKLLLSQKLKELHPFFNKINKAIAQSIVLLGKPAIYSQGQTIYQFYDDKNLSRPKYLYRFQQVSPQSNKSCCLKDIGFMLYGKVQLAYPQFFYSHLVKNFDTLFEHRYIRSNQKYLYNANVLDQTLVIWLSKSDLYLIRRQCFLNMDLKYMFHEFQNFLKYNLIHKKIKKQ